MSRILVAFGYLVILATGQSAKADQLITDVPLGTIFTFKYSTPGSESGYVWLDENFRRPLCWGFYHHNDGTCSNPLYPWVGCQLRPDDLGNTPMIAKGTEATLVKKGTVESSFVDFSDSQYVGTAAMLFLKLENQNTVKVRCYDAKQYYKEWSAPHGEPPYELYYTPVVASLDLAKRVFGLRAPKPEHN